MTIAEEFRIETTFDHIKGLWRKGIQADIIADAFALPFRM